MQVTGSLALADPQSSKSTVGHDVLSGVNDNTAFIKKIENASQLFPYKKL